MASAEGPAAGPVARALVASTPAQRASLAEQKTCVKRPPRRPDAGPSAPYFEVSCKPITVKAEDDMEMLSDLVTWGEQFTDFFEPGLYRARCGTGIYSTRISGKVLRLAFLRKAVQKDSRSQTATFIDVAGYNQYQCRVSEFLRKLRSVY